MAEFDFEAAYKKLQHTHQKARDQSALHERRVRDLMLEIVRLKAEVAKLKSRVRDGD